MEDKDIVRTYCLSDIDSNIFGKIYFSEKKMELKMINEYGGFKSSTILIDYDIYLDGLMKVLKEYNIKLSNSFRFVVDLKHVKTTENKWEFPLLCDIFDLQYMMFTYLNSLEDKKYDYIFYNMGMTQHMMVNKILRESYYNEGCDTYTVNQYIARDICTAFYNLNLSLLLWRGLCAIAAVIILIMILLR